MPRKKVVQVEVPVDQIIPSLPDTVQPQIVRKRAKRTMSKPAPKIRKKRAPNVVHKSAPSVSGTELSVRQKLEMKVGASVLSELVPLLLETTKMGPLEKYNRLMGAVKRAF